MNLKNAKTAKIMNIFNTVLCILCVLVFVGQIYLMCQPYFKFMPELTLKQKKGDEAVPDANVVSLEKFVWLEYANMTEFLLDGTNTTDNLILNEDEDPTNDITIVPGLFEGGVLEEIEYVYRGTLTKKTVNGRTEKDVVHPDILDQIGKKSNSYVMGIVGVTVLGLVMAVMTIFTRKSTVMYAFSIAWAAVGVYLATSENYILENMGIAGAYDAIMKPVGILCWVAVALVALRAIPWFYTRYVEGHKPYIPEELQEQANA